ncbi:hypothetical protein [Gloeocapsopsis sp. IPPAS B-1203]|uniref:hypothetical protein n=1 Tax=Gloeocapsopsis sp. IPPAS B-1203 TaxID=2049454 RepID=UPI00117F42FE|nr:hypothetical protein [Gloeocapsopsis sp. IPPAS B-1203]
MNSNKDLHCPVDCPNRMSRLGKGYSFLFSIALTVLLVWQSCDVKYSDQTGLEIKTRDVPLAILVPSFLLIAGALGINTDPIAQKLGNILTKD